MPFNQLLKRFVSLMGLFPVGKAKILTDKSGARLEAPVLVNTWGRGGRREHIRAVVEAVDPEPVGIDPLAYL